MAMKIKCSRCKATYTGRAEMDTEIWFSKHTCKGKRPLSDMPMDLLRNVVAGEMTEDEAWVRSPSYDFKKTISLD